jgi:spore germination cell wall hydrolase CwlJ-like protein|tara:strand:+ start:1254 stop:1748 length:495 start_codon:yes stop_codon:yes gene_type:complete
MNSLRINRLLSPVVALFVAAVAGPLTVEASSVLSSYDRQVIAAVLVLEAANQGEDGMLAVLHVINNRAGNDPARAVGQVARRKAFSCINSITSQKHPDYGPALRRAMKDRTWPVAMQMVRDYEAGRLGRDITDGETHYCTHPPAGWEAAFTNVANIGDHRFYRR